MHNLIAYNYKTISISHQDKIAFNLEAMNEPERHLVIVQW